MSHKPKIKAKRPSFKKREVHREIFQTCQGIITITGSGFGFVSPVPNSCVNKDIFIPAQNIGNALDNDLVVVEIIKEKDIPKRFQGKGFTGKVVEVIQRNRAQIVGEMITSSRVRPFNKRIPQDILIVGGLREASRGDWVEVKIIYDQMGKEGALKGEIVNIIGSVGNMTADLDAVVAEYAIPSPYIDEDNQKAAQLKPLETITREDFRSHFCITIDPFDAKDHDDAMSLMPDSIPGQWLLGVHIADVAAYIRPKSKWDKEARRRSFTTYLPGRTLPMLPKSLTHLISLRPDQDSLAHSVIFTLDDQGNILKSYRTRSQIRVAQRLTYDQVQDFIDGKSVNEWDSQFKNQMNQMIRLIRLMRKHRQKADHFLTLETTEIRVIIDEVQGKILGIEKHHQRESEELVEECMLAANTAVAIELSDNHIPGLHRVHPEPLPEKLEEFSQFMKETFSLDPGVLVTRADCNHFLKTLPNDHRKSVILTAFLRAMARACYSAESAIHFGLGKMRYTHFTSPIRRYPDLSVHQQLLSFDQKEDLYSQSHFVELGEECSQKEEKSDDAYFAANDRMKLHYLRQQLESHQIDFYEAIISRISTQGIIIEIPDLGLNGFITKESMQSKISSHRKKHRARKENSQTHFKCGEILTVQLERIDFIRGSAYFRPIQK